MAMHEFTFSFNYFSFFLFFFLRVSQPPQTLDELGESLNLWDKLNADKPTIEAKFEPLSEQFAILEKYEVPIPEEVSGSFFQMFYTYFDNFFPSVFLFFTLAFEFFVVVVNCNCCATNVLE